MRTPEIVSVVDGLCENAQRAAQAVLQVGHNFEVVLFCPYCSHVAFEQSFARQHFIELMFVLLMQGDLVALGACLDQYWKQKKLLATDAEPPRVRRIMDALRPHAHGKDSVTASVTVIVIYSSFKKF